MSTDRLDRFADWNRWAILFLVILAAKLWTVRQYGSSVPLLDQWSGEAWRLYKPYLEGNLTFSDLIAAHNEHRILFPRLLFLLLLKVNGLWEPMLQLAVQAALHTAAIVLFIGLCTRSLPPAWRAACTALSAIFWIFPFGWENTLTGFQSPFYFLALFGTLAIWLCWKYNTLSLGWWGSVLASLCGLFCLASGLFVPATCVLLTLLRIWTDRTEWLRHLAGLIFFGALACAGYLMVPLEFRHHAKQSSSLAQLIGGFLTLLSWPCGSALGFLVLQLPFALLALSLLKKRMPTHDPAWLVLAFGAWGWAQALATAYSRANLTLMAPRYLDTFCLTLCASLACLFIWVTRFCHPSRRNTGALLATGWIFFAVFVSVRHFVTITSRQISEWKELSSLREDTVKSYLETHDASLLKTKPIPFTEADALQGWLDDPTIADIMPTRLRPTLHSSRKASGDSFSTRSYFRNGGITPPDNQHYWSSYGFETETSVRGQMELDFSGAKKDQWIEVFVSGQPGAKDMSLVLKDKNGRVHPLSPFLSPGQEWHSKVVKIPAGKFTLEASDDSPDSWLAFSYPRRVGPLSYAVEWLSGFFLSTLAPALLAAAFAFAVLWFISLPERIAKSRFFDVLCRTFTGVPCAAWVKRQS